MRDRGSGLVAALIVVVVLATGALSFMFLAMVRRDELTQQKAVLQGRAEALTLRKQEIMQKLAQLREAKTARETEKGQKETERDQVKGWVADYQNRAKGEASKLAPALNRLAMTVNDRQQENANVERQIDEGRTAFESDERSLMEALRLAGDRLMNTIRQFREAEKVVDTEIADIRAKLDEVRKRLDVVQAEAMRRRVVSDAGGAVLKVGAEGTNFAAVNMGHADRLRKGLRFQVWAPKRGFGLGWVEVVGRDFIRENVLPGDWLVVGSGVDEERYAVVSVGISREAEEDGTGVARRAAPGTLKILGSGVTRDVALSGREWRVERATEATMPPEEWGIAVRGMIEITDVRAHSSDAVVLPERVATPRCPQCGWRAPKPDARYCPYCTVGDSNDEVQVLEQPSVSLLSKGQNPFDPIMEGDRLSNPYFAPNRSLVFCLGSTPVLRSRQMLAAFIQANNGRVVEPEALLVKPEEAAAKTTIGEVMSYEINYLIPGGGPDAEELVRRARTLGIRIMREQELFEFFGETE